MPPSSIDEVLTQLDAVIDDAYHQKSRLGFFAALYRDVTARVGSAIEAGEFEDGPRMERLDVVFARRYLDALEKRGTDTGPPRSWARTFDATDRWLPLILQHVLLGINAHINLDLGIAVVKVADQGELSDLKADFYRINQILGSMIEEVQTRTSTVSPWVEVLDRLGDKADEVISNFCLTRARDDAWEFARTLAPLDTNDRARIIKEKDRETAQRIEKILQPGGPWVIPALAWIRVWEAENVSSVISAISRTWDPD